ncbi:MAG: thiol reductase thioredoxin [Thermofilum sp. ex4484_79]|nr:MAG: thiol reductase thioredoxin [Thermofilum sp. ex4484_79]
MNEIPEVGDKLPEIIKKYKIVIVDCWAEWCIPCKAVEEILKRLQRKFKNVYMCKLNVDENQELASQYGVLNLPTILIFHNGKEEYRFTGAPSDLSRKLIQILSKY